MLPARYSVFPAELCYPDVQRTQAGAEVLRIGHFLSRNAQFGLVFSHSFTTAVSPNTPSIHHFSGR